MLGDPGVLDGGHNRHTDQVRCAVHRPFPLLVWAAVPVLFTAAVLGLTSLGEFLLSSPAGTVLTSGHLGASAAVTAIVGLSVEWPANLRAARWIYPIVVFVLGLILHGTEVPAAVALLTGLPSAAVLAGITWRNRFSRDRDRQNRGPALVGTSAR
jgi:hypothetical protein